MEDKQARLEQLAEQLRQLHDSPLYELRQQNGYLPVFGEGDPQARIMLIGEAPGEKEAKSGRPFVGSAGRQLDRLLASAGLERKDVYITNIVKDRPPGNRDPSAREVAVYRPILLEQIAIIQPRLIITLGRFALAFVMELFDLPQRSQKIGELHGQVLPARASYGKVAILPLYHPAATFYNDQLKATLEQDFQAIKEFL